jgi:ankyrin repeat protein
MLAVGTDGYSLETVRMLLEQGADTRPKTRAGESALDWAYKFGDSEVLKALNASPKTPTSLILNKEAPSVRAAVEQNLRLLDKTTTQFFNKSGCFACHEQPPGEFAAATARAKGIQVDEKASRERRLQITSTLVSSGPCSWKGPPPWVGLITICIRWKP